MLEIFAAQWIEPWSLIAQVDPTIQRTTFKFTSAGSSSSSSRTHEFDHILTTACTQLCRGGFLLEVLPSQKVSSGFDSCCKCRLIQLCFAEKQICFLCNTLDSPIKIGQTLGIFIKLFTLRKGYTQMASMSCVNNLLVPPWSNDY